MGLRSKLSQLFQIRYASPRGYLVEVEGPRSTSRFAFGEEDLLKATESAARWRKMMDNGSPAVVSVSFYYLSDAQLIAKRTRSLSQVWEPKGPYSPEEARKAREASQRAREALRFDHWHASPVGAIARSLAEYVDQCEEDTAEDCPRCRR